MSNFALRSLLESRALHVRPVNGAVGFGSNSSTSKQITAALTAAEIRRAELIDMVNPRTVWARNG